MGKDEREPHDDIPPVHVLEAMQEQDRKETADLLSGFDRPGRTPRKAPPPRDFVEYYATKSPSGRAAPEPRRHETSPHEKATVVLPRKHDARTVVLWAAAVLGMVLFGAMIAVLATPEPQPTASPRSTPTLLPSSATTITSAPATPPEQADDQADEPDEPAETTATTVIVATPPPRPAKSAPATTAGAQPPPGGATSIKTAPRDDFIRDM